MKPRKRNRLGKPVDLTARSYLVGWYGSKKGKPVNARLAGNLADEFLRERPQS